MIRTTYQCLKCDRQYPCEFIEYEDDDMMNIESIPPTLCNRNPTLKPKWRFHKLEKQIEYNEHTGHYEPSKVNNTTPLKSSAPDTFTIQKNSVVEIGSASKEGKLTIPVDFDDMTLTKLRIDNALDSLEYAVSGIEALKVKHNIK